eukprot:6572010-Lingulodinium_polyedra.AAC.1
MLAAVMGAAREVIRHRGITIAGADTAKATMEAMTEAVEKGRRVTPASAGVPVGKGVLAHDHPDGGDKAWFGV